jgi:hypothetical protein
MQSLTSTTHRQYGTICRGGQSLLERIAKHHPTVNPSDYVTFHSLRNYATELSNDNTAPVTEQIYVHAKVSVYECE